MHRIKGIDSLRIVCAMFVVLSHNAFFFPPSIPKYLNPMINGPSAVIVFFLISGFCIHFPNKEKLHLNVISFYTRRFIRILIPAFIAYAVSKSVGVISGSPDFGIFWSVICEVIYYVLYPLLLSLRNKYGWMRLIVTSYMIAFGIALLNLDILSKNHEYPILARYTWIIGLPCWLLGCWLAENTDKFPVLSFYKIWAVRVGMYLASCIVLILKFHVNSPFSSYIISLNVLAIAACIWLGLEIMYFTKKNPSRLLEWGGKWSYSLYIIHPAVQTFIGTFKIQISVSFYYTCFVIFASLLVSYLFYLIVELPSHRLAVTVSKLSYLKQLKL